MQVLAPLSFLLLLAIISFADAENANNNYDQDKNWWSKLSLVIHRNGEPDPCGTTSVMTKELIDTLSSASDKYEMEARLTGAIHDILTSDSSCYYEEEVGDGKEKTLYSFCDRGPEKTPILLDHKKLIRTTANTLPCRWFTREGLRISTVEQLEAMVEKAKNNSTAPSCANPQDADGSCQDDTNGIADTEIHLYAVPAGRVFLFAPAYVGEIFQLDHMTLLPDENKPIVLEVLSTNPKVFDILNVFTKEEAEGLVERALAETSPTHKIKRSTTGTSDRNLFSKRTSENGFDTHGKIALAVKQRIFEMLGFDEYWNGHDDGLQVLRYNMSMAYTPHMDYLVDRTKNEPFNYDSAGKGGNRFATVLLYMTDLPENGGGETVFSEAWPAEIPEHERKTPKAALRELRESGDAERAGIEQGSWEEQMVATCRSKLSVKPHSGRAVLFYSQLPNGEQDLMSKHGGCPVLQGTKWAANLWVWNTPRGDFAGAPMREGFVPRTDVPSRNVPKQLQAVFVNSGADPAMANAVLYYDEAQYWGPLGHGDKPLRANTFEGHRWNVRVDDKVVKSWVIGKDEVQKFTI